MKEIRRKHYALKKKLVGALVLAVMVILALVFVIGVCKSLAHQAEASKPAGAVMMDQPVVVLLPNVPEGVKTVMTKVSSEPVDPQEARLSKYGFTKGGAKLVPPKVK